MFLGRIRVEIANNIEQGTSFPAAYLAFYTQVTTPASSVTVTLAKSWR